MQVDQVAARGLDPPCEAIRKHGWREEALAPVGVAPERDRVEERTRERSGFRDSPFRSVDGRVVRDLALDQKPGVEADSLEPLMETIGGSGRAADTIERAEEEGSHGRRRITRSRTG